MTPDTSPPAARTKVLCVDDEPNVLAGLSLYLRRRYDVQTALSGAAGLTALRDAGDTAVVISDMRMPGMDGAAFLSACRQTRPDTVRMLLTGHADMDSAVHAVNEGQIFRFLTKPCPPSLLLSSVEAALAQHRLLTAERVLLEQTLHGSVKALIDVLALANPVAFGRAIRIKQLVSDLAASLDPSERWQVEVAAMLSQIGCMSLPPETLERVYYGRPLSDDEQQMVARVPALTANLLGSIPRLDAVRGILASYTRTPPRTDAVTDEGGGSVVARGARLLAAATDFEVLTAQGHPAAHVLDVMRGRPGRYHPAILDTLTAIHAAADAANEVHEVSLAALRVGMVLAEDVTLTTGTLLVTRGYTVTEGFVERARNFRGKVREPLRVVLRSGSDEAAAT